MTQNDNSWSREDTSCRKPTRHIEMIVCNAGFFAQSSELGPYFPDT